MTKRRRHGQHRRRRTDWVRSVVPTAAAVLMIAVIVLVVLALRGCGGNTDAVSGEIKTTQDGTDVRQDGAQQTDSGTQPEDGAADAGSEGASAEAESGQETEAADETGGAGAEDGTVHSAVAAEVGSMEDEEDPQGGASAAGTGGGASVDLNAAAKAEGETDEATLGIDVSKYQGNIDWEQVAQSGVEFAMVRVGYRTKVTGIIYEDPGARYNLQEAAKNGILVGAYFFSSAVTEEEAREEAAWTAAFISRYPITYPVAYNCEDFQSPDSRQYGLGVEERTRNRLRLSGYDRCGGLYAHVLRLPERNGRKRPVEHGHAGEQVPGLGVPVSGEALAGNARFHLQRDPCHVAVYQPGNGGRHPGQRGRESGLLRIQPGGTGEGSDSGGGGGGQSGAWHKLYGSQTKR